MTVRLNSRRLLSTTILAVALAIAAAVQAQQLTKSVTIGPLAQPDSGGP